MNARQCASIFSGVIRGPVPTGFLVSHVGLHRQRGMVAELWYCAREKEARKVLTRRPEDKKKRRDFDRLTRWRLDLQEDNANNSCRLEKGVLNVARNATRHLVA